MGVVMQVKREQLTGEGPEKAVKSLTEHFEKAECQIGTDKEELVGCLHTGLAECSLPCSSSASASSPPDATESSNTVEDRKEDDEMELDVEGDGPSSINQDSDIEKMANNTNENAQKMGIPNNTGKPPVEKRHKCEQCGKRFPYFSILEAHKRCHTGEKPFSCQFCDKKFAQKATLQVHERTHTGERPYKCKYCEKTFAQYGTKTVHEKSAHLGIRNYKCPYCPKSLSSPSALYTHKKTHGEKNFQCPCCPKTFTLKNYLKLHVRQVHEQTERKHCCRFCPKSFAYAGSLQVHLRTHTGERPYRCRYCPKAFASQGNLQSHERTHTGEKPFICKQCGRAFIQKSQLTAHEGTHASSSSNGSLGSSSKKSKKKNRQKTAESPATAFSSNLCGSQHFPVHTEHIDESGIALPVAQPLSLTSMHSAQFQQQEQPLQTQQFQCLNQIVGHPIVAQTDKNQQILLENEDLSTTETTKSSIKQPGAEFICKFCGKRYAYASSLYVHTRLHTGERPFRCQYCDKSFTNQGNMQVHLRVHTGEKPFCCEACGKSYAQKIGLKIHQEQCQLWLNRRGSIATESCSSAGTSAGINEEQELETNFTVDAIDQEGSSRNHLTFLNSMGGDGQRQQEKLLHLLLREQQLQQQTQYLQTLAPAGISTTEVAHLLANPLQAPSSSQSEAYNLFQNQIGQQPSNSLAQQLIPPEPQYVQLLTNNDARSTGNPFHVHTSSSPHSQQQHQQQITTLLLEQYEQQQQLQAIRALLDPPQPVILPQPIIAPVQTQAGPSILLNSSPMNTSQNILQQLLTAPIPVDQSISILQQLLQHIGPLEDGKLSELVTLLLARTPQQHPMMR